MHAVKSANILLAVGLSNPASLKLIKGALQSIQACKPMSSRTVRSYWCVLETRGALRFICPARLTIGKGLLSESHLHCFKSSSAVPPLQSGRHFSSRKGHLFKAALLSAGMHDPYQIDSRASFALQANEMPSLSILSVERFFRTRFMASSDIFEMSQTNFPKLMCRCWETWTNACLHAHARLLTNGWCPVKPLAIPVATEWSRWWPILPKYGCNTSFQKPEVSLHHLEGTLQV